MTYFGDELRYKCLSCAESMPTHKVTRTSNGMCGAGDSEYQVDVYDDQNAYFVRLENCEETKEVYQKSLMEILETQTKRIGADMLSIPQEYRDWSSQGAVRGLKSKTESKDSDLSSVFDVKINKKFGEKRYYWLADWRHEGLAIHANCLQNLLQNADKVEEYKYVVENGEKKVLDLDAVIDAGKAQVVLAYLFKHLAAVTEPNFPNDYKLTFGFAHFSEITK